MDILPVFHGKEPCARCQSKWALRQRIGGSASIVLQRLFAFLAFLAISATVLSLRSELDGLLFDRHLIFKDQNEPSKDTNDQQDSPTNTPVTSSEEPTTAPTSTPPTTSAPTSMPPTTTTSPPTTTPPITLEPTSTPPTTTEPTSTPPTTPQPTTPLPTFVPTVSPTRQCNGTDVAARLIIDLDRAAPGDVSWQVTDSQGDSVPIPTLSAAGLQANTQHSLNLGCLDPTDCYTFTIYDTAGDGLCCRQGIGSYRIQWGDEIRVERDGDFGYFESVTFGNTAACPPPHDDGSFSITLVDRTPGGAPPQYAQAFQDAKMRWEEAITNDMEDVPAVSLDWFRGEFAGNYSAAFDDIAIGYSIEYIDGVSGTLGFAGCVAGFGNRCYSGIMKFEEIDFDARDLEDVQLIILHEMGHILGAVGTSGNCALVCKFGFGNSYTCPIAEREYEALSTGTPLLLENNGTSGSRCVHWEEDSFQGNSSELMTARFETNRYQPLSRVTLGALDDLGIYQINYDAADEWPFVPSSSGRNERKVLQAKSNFYLPLLMQDVSWQ